MTLKSFAQGLPFIGGLFGDNASEEQQKRLGKMAKQYEAQLDPMKQARMNALAQSMSLFGPLNNQLGRLYGSDAMFDFGSLLQDPMRDYNTEVARSKNQPIADLWNQRYQGQDKTQTKELTDYLRKHPESVEQKFPGVRWNPQTNMFEVA